MAAKPLTSEQLNFFKFSALVLDEFPKVLRQIFITMWNSKVAIRPGLVIWDDSPKVRNMFLTCEGGKTAIPTTKSIEEWDCTDLFEATIYAKTFGDPTVKGSTLNDLFLKKKLAPGPFHSSVQSPAGDQDETYALAIDQLRLLRNTLLHSWKPEIVKTDFDKYVQLVTSVLIAVNVDTYFVDVIGQISEDDLFMSEDDYKCRATFNRALRVTDMILKNMKQKLSLVEERTDRGNVTENIPSMLWESHKTNFFCMQHIISNIASEALRKVFKQQWNTHEQELGEWDDTLLSGQKFVQLVGREINPSFVTDFQLGDTNNWSFVCLHKAIVHLDGIRGFYFSGRVRRAVEGLATIRNKMARENGPYMSEETFQHMIGLVVTAFTVLEFPINEINRINAERSLPVVAKKVTDLEGKSEKIADLNWKQVTVKHRKKFERLLQVCKSKPDLITLVNDNVVCFEEDFSIGRGSYGTEVYICLGVDGVERAIKTLPKNLCKKFLKNECDILTSKNAVESPRIINYCFYDDTSHPYFGYIILSLHEENLEECIKEESKVITESRARKMIRQVLDGLKAIHCKEPRILHRDLKPTNVLVNVNGDLVLSDFGIGRFFPEKGATSYNTSSERGSRGWVPYECIDWDALESDKITDIDAPVQFKWKEKSDVQVAGMLAYYIFTKGKHAFGPVMRQLENLKNDNPVGLATLSDPVLKDLLTQMLSRDQEKRPYVEQALQHPYFLSCKEQMKFLESVGNEREIKMVDDTCTVVKDLDNLDPLKPQNPLLPKDWKARIDPDDLNTFCEGGKPPSKLDGGRYTHWLRLMRNVRQHWGDKPSRPPLKGIGHGTCLEEYFLQLFPSLPLVVHQIIREYSDWKARPALEEYFPVVNRSEEPDED